MTKSVAKLAKELQILEQNISQLAEQFREIYRPYLALLSQIVSQQLIFAAFRICTEYYPQQFLELSYSQREKLQQKLRQISKIDFSSLLDNPTNIAEPLDQEETESIDEQVGAESTQISIPEEPMTQPEQLLFWLDNLEETLENHLEAVSNQANRLLKKNKLLPEQIPLKILEMAINSEDAAKALSSAPNLLNLLIETGTSQDELSHHSTPIVVIRLRLTEMELTNYQLNNYRQQIRQMVHQLKQLSYEYQQKQQEYLIAEATTAWRSSWYED